MWLFSDHTKWYTLESYKFGEPIVTEDSLMEMVHIKDIAAFTYAMYRTDEDEKGDWADICNSIRIIFGVVELKENAMHNWLRTRYLPIEEIPSPNVYKEAPPFVLQSVRRPRLWVEPHELACRKCGDRQYKIRNSCNTGFCPNVECDQFKLCSITIQSIDFNTGPLNDMRLSIKSKRHTNVDVDSELMVCVRCKIYTNCRRSLEKKGVCCKRHPICTHFVKRHRFV